MPLFKVQQALYVRLPLENPEFTVCLFFLTGICIFLS